MTAFFVTSTGTDIGKTYVGCGLISHWRAKGRKVDAYKPLLSGFDPAQLVESDAGRLLTALGRPVNAETLDQVSPWRYAAAISADAAAAKEGKQVEYPAVLAASRAFLQGAHDVALIEGAGGIMAPLSDDRTMLDFAVDIRIPAILVVGSYLGTISHSLTALSIMEARAGTGRAHHHERDGRQHRPAGGQCAGARTALASDAGAMRCRATPPLRR